MRISIIVAMDNNGLIGKDNTLPWHLPADLAYFKKNTTGKVVLMGRKTYESIGKALPNRRNIIVTRNIEFQAQGCEVVNSIQDALEIAKNEQEIMIIGGVSFYSQTLKKADRLYITQIDSRFDGDAYFPQFDKSNFIEISKENHKADEKNPYDYSFVVLDRK